MGILKEFKIKDAADIDNFNSSDWNNSGLKWNKNISKWGPSSFTTEGGSPTPQEYYYPANVIVYNENNNYYARNGKTGDIMYSDTSASNLLQNVFNDSPYSSVRLLTDIKLDYGITGNNGVLFDLDGHTITLNSNFAPNSKVFRVKPQMIVKNGTFNCWGVNTFENSVCIYADGEDRFAAGWSPIYYPKAFILENLVINGRWAQTMWSPEIWGTGIEYYLDGPDGENIAFTMIKNCKVAGFNYGILFYNHNTSGGPSTSYINGNMIEGSVVIESKYLITLKRDDVTYNEVNGNYFKNCILQPNSMRKTLYQISSQGISNYFDVFSWDKQSYMTTYTNSGQIPFYWGENSTNNVLFTNSCFTNSWDEQRDFVKDNGYKFHGKATNFVIDGTTGRWMNSLEMGSGNKFAFITRGNDSIFRFYRDIGSNNSYIFGGNDTGENVIIRSNYAQPYPAIWLMGGDKVAIQALNGVELLNGPTSYFKFDYPSRTLQGLNEPINDSDAANKQYVDNKIGLPENYGWVNVASNESFEHNCNGIPKWISVTPSGNNPISYACTSDDTYITINHTSPDSETFAWRAIE